MTMQKLILQGSGNTIFFCLMQTKLYLSLFLMLFCSRLKNDILKYFELYFCLPLKILSMGIYIILALNVIKERDFYSKNISFISGL